MNLIGIAAVFCAKLSTSPHQQKWLGLFGFQAAPWPHFRLIRFLLLNGRTLVAGILVISHSYLSTRTGST